jgi:hypothetical protein
VLNIEDFKYDEDSANELATYLLGEPYYPFEFTREYYENRLKILKNIDTKNFSDYQIEKYNIAVEAHENILASENLLETEETKSTSEKASDTFRYKAYNHGNALSYLYVSNDFEDTPYNPYSMVYYIRNNDFTAFYEDNDINEFNLTTNLEEFYNNAYDIATKAVNDLTNEMILSNVVLAEKRDIFSVLSQKENYTPNININAIGLDEIGIVFYFTKRYPILGSNSNSAYAISKINDENNSLDIEETIKVIIDSEGIAEFEWIGKRTITSQSIIDKSVISFHEALEGFKKQVFNVIHTETKATQVDITINKIMLSVKNIENEDGNKVATPVYSFSGYKTVTCKTDKVIESMIGEEFTFLINAIDSTIIE